MKRTTLRTSAIALGVAAALPATAQEWNIGWGGFMHHHIVFGSTEHKRTGERVKTEKRDVTVEREITITEDTLSATLKGLDELKGSFTRKVDSDRTTLTVGGNTIPVIAVANRAAIRLGKEAVDAEIERRVTAEEARSAATIAGLTGDDDAAARAAEARRLATALDGIRKDRTAAETALRAALSAAADNEGIVDLFEADVDPEDDSSVPVPGVFLSAGNFQEDDLEDLQEALEALLEDDAGDDEDLGEGQSLQVPIFVTSSGTEPKPFEVDETTEVEITGGQVDGQDVEIDLSGQKITVEVPTGETETVNVGAEKVNTAIKRSGSAQNSNTEVHFKPSVTLENGLTFAARIEFEGDEAGVDRSYMDISSDDLGMIRLGAHPSMGYGMMVGAPGVGLGINEAGGHTLFIPVHTNGGAALGSATEVGDNWEAMRVSYQTPSLNGLTLGVSYAADGVAAGNARHTNGNLKTSKEAGKVYDIIDLGLKFKQSLGETSVTIGARYGTGKIHEKGDGQKDPREMGIGAQVGFGAFTFGGSYTDSERNEDSSSGWNLGMEYDMEGPWKFGIETYQGKLDHGGKNSASKIAASRNLGSGVDWDLYAITASSDRMERATYTKDGKSHTASLKDERSGTIFGTSIKLSF